MHLSSARKTNVTFEDENPSGREKRQVSDTPRRAFGDVKNMVTPSRSSLKDSLAAQKSGLQFVKSNLETLEERARAALDIDDDAIEEANLQEDPKIECNLFQREDSVILSDQDNDAEYFGKLMSAEYDEDNSITDDDETIEMCGLEDEPFDYSHVMNDVEGNAILTDDFPLFQYERPDKADLDKAKKYTLQEIEDLFESFSDVLIF
ncbi:hypothetical protein KIN20_022900 [Parelaphostrongylus tenuis]|uniref:Uncharacterized protein n=1 Tax=Parelaphostrongylus tenuis TaxID=148309 RepID=A0AAD5N9K4_PARTN|nr:hypothetical protein KIN20_022900 [Parelaphostrongylus tenuis]